MDSNKKYKLSLDYHGVIDALPGFFAFLTRAVVEAGGEIHIVTGCTLTPQIEANLAAHGIVWNHLFSVYNYLIDTGVEIVGEVEFPDGTIQKKFADGLWDKAKGGYCKQHQIDLHIDDTLIYENFFSTGFCRFWSNNGKIKKSHKDIRHLA